MINLNSEAIRILEYDKIKETLASLTQSGLGKRLVERMSPRNTTQAIDQELQETTEARRLLDAGYHVPLIGLSDTSDTADKLARGAVLPPAELVQIADLLRGANRLRNYMKDKREFAPLLHSYSLSLQDLSVLEELILASIEGSTVSNNASSKLKKIRQEIQLIESRIEQKLSSIISSNSLRPYLQDYFISVKDGRFVIPIKATYKHKIDGLIVGSSGSGSTVFVEPASVRKLSNELHLLRQDEENEVYQVLAMLSGEALAVLPKIRLNMETMAVFDFALAKGKYSRHVGGTSPSINTKRRFRLESARHPLLGQTAVPLSFELGTSYRTLLITGPNTGGKTVALKTVGLLTLMAQSGLHIPAQAGAEIALCNEVLVDIGDGQSIEHSLSTFSSHMKNIAAIVKRASPACLVLIDEIGTGTDPQEGAALAAAVLEELYRLGAMTVATTHYSDIKRFADNHPGFANGMMDFDQETLQPLYRLVIGQAGSSNGLVVAERLGLKTGVVNRAKDFLQGQAAPAPLTEVVTLQQSGQFDVTEAKPTTKKRPGDGLSLGDRVYVHTIKQSGIVAELPDDKGIMTVIVKRQPVHVNHTRVSLQLKKEELYPDHENYDLNIVLMSKSDRKLHKAMSKGHVTGKARIIRPDK